MGWFENLSVLGAACYALLILRQAYNVSLLYYPTIAQDNEQSIQNWWLQDAFTSGGGRRRQMNNHTTTTTKANELFVEIQAFASFTSQPCRLFYRDFNANFLKRKFSDNECGSLWTINNISYKADEQAIKENVEISIENIKGISERENLNIHIYIYPQGEDLEHILEESKEIERIVYVSMPLHKTKVPSKRYENLIEKENHFLATSLTPIKKVFNDFGICQQLKSSESTDVSCMEEIVRQESLNNGLDGSSTSISSCSSSDSKANSVNDDNDLPELDYTPQLHLKSKAELNLVYEDYSYPIDFSKNEGLNLGYRRYSDRSRKYYIPNAVFNTFWQSSRSYVPIKDYLHRGKAINLTLEFKMVSSGKSHMLALGQNAFNGLEESGFTDADIDPLKNIIFTYTPMYLLIVFMITVLHMLFDFLAFKNEITYWKNTKNLKGVSSRSVIMSCIFQIIVFLNLMDQGTTYLVTVPTFIQIIIDIWKSCKALKIQFDLSSFKLSYGALEASEEETDKYDAYIMGVVSKVLYPVMFGYSVYSLVCEQHTGWYSWLLRSLAGYVYTFGFILMLPQVYINYRLKSTAYMNKRTLMYKFFNTSIDNIFAYTLNTPLIHKVASHRDDVVFAIFLYQRYVLYGEDRSRVNEYGMVADEFVTERVDENLKSKKNDENNSETDDVFSVGEKKVLGVVGDNGLRKRKVVVD